MRKPIGITVPYREVVKKESKIKFIDLTAKEIDIGLVSSNYLMKTAEAWRDGVEWAIKQLKEKNK